MRRIKIVQLGVGHDHGECALGSMIKQSDLFEVAALALPQEEEAQFGDTAAKYSGIAHMSVERALEIPGLDAVVVETQDERLTKYAMLAAERGLSLHIDKAGGFDHGEYARLIKTVRDNGRVFHTGYMYRYNPAISSLIERVRSGELGEIYAVEAHMSCLHDTEKRRWLEKFPGGMMYFLGCHLVDLILQLQGVPERLVPMSTSTGLDGVDTVDYGMALFCYKNGVSFAKTCAAEPGGFYRRQLVVCGSRGTVELRPLEAFAAEQGSTLYTEGCEVDYRDAVEKGWRDTRKMSRTPPFDRYDAMMADFAALVRGEAENPYSYEYEERLHRTVLAACGADIDYKKETEW